MSKRGIDGDLVGIDDVTVVDPDLPAWHIIQRTTHQGRTYKVYHGPLGEYAESKKQAILLSSGVPLSAAMLAPKTRWSTALERSTTPGKEQGGTAGRSYV